MKHLPKLFPIILLLFAIGNSTAQTSISGVINEYTKVNAIDFCNNTAVVTDPSDFAVGDQVLLIQMQGAVTDPSDNAGYGGITDIRNAGNYEIAEIDDIAVNIVTFSEGIVKMYDMDGAIQMVSVPQYFNVDIDDTLKCAPWNDSTGGVLIFEAGGTVTFNADVYVAGLGFKGGTALNTTSCSNGGAGSNTYRCDATGMCGGAKGQGISDPGTANYGRGAIANGGGGGNDHNTGGGGGGCAGSGGQGGERRNTSGADCLGTNPGIGGYALSISNASQKVYMGGGGGAGDENQNEGTSGGNGGGIVIIIANEIDAGGANIYAMGQTVEDTAHADGAGGAGAGGSVLLISSNFTSALNVDVSGGDGGHVDNALDPDSCFGPGGGGAGGVLWVSEPALPGNISFNAGGGAAGRNVNGNAPAGCINSSNNAAPGMGGTSIIDCVIPRGTDAFIPLSVQAFGDTTVCSGDTVNLTATGTGTAFPTFEWSEGSMVPDISVSPVNTTIYTVSVSDNRNCTVVDQVIVTTAASQVTAAADADTILEGDTVVLAASNSITSTYAWTPTSLLDDPNNSNPGATPTSTTTFCVEATDSNGCLSEACVTIWVDSIPDSMQEAIFVIPNAFSPNGDGMNDSFGVLSEGPIEISDFRIYNRWGQVVHEVPIPWDGNYNNSEQPPGTYVYLVTILNTATMEVEKRAGVLSLLR